MTRDARLRESGRPAWRRPLVGSSRATGFEAVCLRVESIGELPQLGRRARIENPLGKPAAAVGAQPQLSDGAGEVGGVIGTLGHVAR